MAYTLELDYFTNDLKIDSSGHFRRISGGQEVCQRVRIALQHQFSEYFLNRLGGVPYYTKDQVIDRLWEQHENYLASLDHGMIWMNLTRADIGLNWKKD